MKMEIKRLLTILTTSISHKPLRYTLMTSNQLDTNQSSGPTLPHRRHRSPVLEYVAASRRSAGRRWKLACLLAGAVVGLLGVRHWGIPWAEQAWYLARQNQCASYAPEGSTLAYEQHIADRQLVLSANMHGMVPVRFLSAGMFGDSGDPLGAIGRSLGCARAIGLSEPGIVFLHERHTPRGQPLIVAISLVPCRGNSQYSSAFMAHSFYGMPVGWRPGSRVKWIDGDMIWSMPVSQQEDFRAFMGTPDASDSSKFTIPYELDGQAGIIDGYVWGELSDREGNVVTLVARTGPAVARSQ